MKYSGYNSLVTKTGRVTIPPMVLNRIGIDGKASVKFSLTQNGITVEKFLPRCLVTGKSSEHVIKINANLYLSREGMEILLIKIEAAMSSN